MSIYIISGKDTYRQEKCLEHLIEENGIEKDNIYTYDAEDKKTFYLENALIECGSLSLFTDYAKKCVIVKNPFFLNAVSKGKEDSSDKDERVKSLENYLKDPNEDALLVFYCEGFDADKRKSEYKLLMKYGCTDIPFLVLKQWEFDKYVDAELKENKLKLSFDAKGELLKRINNDTMSLHNAIEKLLLIEKNEIDIVDIKALVSLNPDVNVFDMSNFFVQKNLTRTLQSIEDMKKANYSYADMLPMLASRLRSFYQIKKLYEMGLDEPDITAKLHANPYAIKKSLENCSEVSSKDILKYLSQLADIDQGYKSGTLDLDAEFESFILHSGD